MIRNLGKWLATAVCVLLLFVDATMARNFHGGSTIRADIPAAVGQIGGRLPDFTLSDIDGKPTTLSQFYGKGPILLTFDRSVDW